MNKGKSSYCKQNQNYKNSGNCYNQKHGNVFKNKNNNLHFQITI